ncbi:protoheme IX farnesyltransferase [bacterium]|nr:protoheme IX farnesyltransferase [bacterium]
MSPLVLAPPASIASGLAPLPGPPPKAEGSAGAEHTVSRARDYLTLVRPKIALLVLVTVAVSACLAAHGAPPLALLVHTLVGTALVAGASSALNQILERDTDALMRRTESRPLPAGRLTAREVLAFSIVLATAGLAELAVFATPLAALVAGASLAIYVLAYTPLKRTTSLNTLVGAVPGALPPVIGWTAVTGALEPAALVLFGIVFVWQFPHFLAIAWLNREDYERAGLKMLPAIAGGRGMTGRQSTNYCLALVPVSLAPALVGLAGTSYFLGALYLGLAFTGVAVAFALKESRENARRLLLASVVYLPALLGLMWIDR